jgi:hypothetical protein
MPLSAGDTRRVSRRTPDQPLPPPRRQFRRRERIAALKTIERGSRQRYRKERRQRRVRQRRHMLMRNAQVSAPDLAKLAQRGADAGRRRLREWVVWPNAVTGQHLGRDV